MKRLLLVFILSLSFSASGSSATGLHEDISEADERQTLQYLGQWDERSQFFGPGFELSWPVPPPIQLVRGFKKRPRKHHGLDLDGETGDPIYAAHEGRVVYASNKIRGYGNLVIIESAQWSTYYAHLSVLQVRQGQVVRRHQLLGKMGQTGNATGSHLHFELRRDGEAIDPMSYLEKLLF